MRLAWLLAVLLLVGLVASPFVVVRAQDVEDETVVEGESDGIVDIPDVNFSEEEFRIAGPSPDVKTTILFTETQDNEFPGGEIVRALIGVSNTGLNDITVIGVVGQFRHPQDLKHINQNFTAKELGVNVVAQTQASFEYVFRPEYEARSHFLILNIYYNDTTGAEYVDSVFNSTVTVIEADEPFQIETLYTIVTLIALIGGGGFFAYQQLAPQSAKKTKKVTAIETGTSSSGSNEWLSNLNTQPVGKKVRK